MSIDYLVNALGSWSLMYDEFLKLKLLLLTELYEGRSYSSADLRAVWIGLNEMLELVGSYGHQKHCCRTGKWGQKLVHQKQFEKFLVLEQSKTIKQPHFVKIECLWM